MKCEIKLENGFTEIIEKGSRKMLYQEVIADQKVYILDDQSVFKYVFDCVTSRYDTAGYVVETDIMEELVGFIDHIEAHYDEFRTFIVDEVYSALHLPDLEYIQECCIFQEEYE